MYIFILVRNLAFYQTRVALDEWLTNSVGKQTWAQAGNCDVYKRVLRCVMDIQGEVEELLQQWWSSA